MRIKDQNEGEGVDSTLIVGLQSHLATFPLDSHFEASFRDQISAGKMGLERGEKPRGIKNYSN